MCVFVVRNAARKKKINIGIKLEASLGAMRTRCVYVYFVSHCSMAQFLLPGEYSMQICCCLHLQKKFRLVASGFVVSCRNYFQLVCPSNAAHTRIRT